MVVLAIMFAGTGWTGGVRDRDDNARCSFNQAFDQTGFSSPGWGGNDIQGSESHGGWKYKVLGEGDEEMSCIRKFKDDMTRCQAHEELMNNFR
jgi:hypothetical protein